MKLNIKILTDDIKMPTYGSDYAAGLDICSSINTDILPNSRMLIPTGISISWEGEDEQKYYIRVAPRSGLSSKKMIDVGAGVIDYDYRGEIFILLINNSNTIFNIQKGDRIAQLILTKIDHFSTIDIVDNHKETLRGLNGFGSTGI